MASKVSDGHHTFEELYEHRYALFIALCHVIADANPALVWKSKQHSDGTMFEDSFIAGMFDGFSQIISYHLPLRLWDRVKVCELDHAPAWDGHTSEHVVARLYERFKR